MASPPEIGSASLPTVSVVVPVFNGERSLPELVARLSDVLASLTSAHEIILVDDGSRDDSWQTIEKLARERPAVRGLQLMRNYGQHNALLAGTRSARFELIVTMDDDLQHRPEVLGQLLDALEPDVDLVYGRPAEEAHDRWRNVSSRLLRFSLGVTLGFDVARKASALRLFRAQLRDAFGTTSDAFVSLDVLLTWATERSVAVVVPMDERKYGRSNYSFFRLAGLALTTITSYSTRPLRFVTWLGFSLALFGVGLLAFVIGRLLILGYSVPGFPLLASAISIFSGAQLFALGVVGEYLGRIHFRTMNRPPYALRRVTDAGGPAATP